MSTSCRLSEHQDIDQILDLQDKNLVTRIAESDKIHGFVTTPFEKSQLEHLITLGGMFVAQMEHRVVGYAAAAHWDYFQGRPMFDLMICRFEKRDFNGKNITRANSFQYGPVCIAKEVRGSGVFQSLFDEMERVMKRRFEVGTTFINKINVRSYEAHTRKMGLQVIDEFDFGGNEYWGLAF